MSFKGYYADSKESLFSINKMREVLGLKPLTSKVRKCLRCDKNFMSTQMNERLCGCGERV